jgi:hypothetical protein
MPNNLNQHQSFLYNDSFYLFDEYFSIDEWKLMV